MGVWGFLVPAEIGHISSVKPDVDDKWHCSKYAKLPAAQSEVGNVGGCNTERATDGDQKEINSMFTTYLCNHLPSRQSQDHDPRVSS